MIGTTKGLLTVESEAGRGPRGVSWWCRCQCGTLVKLSTFRLTTEAQSCGCARRDWSDIITAPTAEMLRTQKLTVVSWRGVLARCVVGKKKHACYEKITICDRWYDSANFFDDMGSRPGIEYSIDRIDSDGNYEPSNCRWLLKSENCGRIRFNLTPERNAKVAEGVHRAHAEGKILTPEARAKIALGGAKRKGRKMRKCEACGCTSYLELCNKCQKTRASGDSVRN